MSTLLFGRKIGVMGGTFDPIHNGHLVLAEQIRALYYLDEVIFVPNSKPPHKPNQCLANKYERLEMTKLAIQSNPFFSVSDIEVIQDQITYTVDTMRALKEGLSASDQLFFITGADALATLESWKEFEYLIKNVHFIGATRPGTALELLKEKVSAFKSIYAAKIDLCEITSLSISSTDIRERVQRELSIKYIVPESVEDYILKQGLYKSHHAMYSIVFTYLKNTLSQKRFSHSVEVAKLSRKLAIRYGVDPLKAEFAGLCHDIAKEVPNEEMKKSIFKFNIFYDPSFKSVPNLAHGEVGACLLNENFDIIDEDILNAVRWHTYGNDNMSILSKIIYLADVIEPSRKFLGVEQLRHMIWIDLDETIITYYKMTQTHLENSKSSVHTYTQKMIHSIKEDSKE